MKENVLTSFIRDTYKTTSIIPYVITGQVVLFILLHIFDLITFSEKTSVDLYTIFYTESILPVSFREFLSQPWSLLTHPFIYTSLWNLLFDCLWLYWMGQLFLNLLHTRQFNSLFIGGTFVGAILFLILGFIPLLSTQPLYWHTTAFGLAAIISSLVVLVPNYEIRLLLLGNIKLKWIAAVYLGFQFAFLISTNKAAALSYLCIVFGGMLFMHQLQRGKDWSNFFIKKKRKLKVIRNNYENQKLSEQGYPNQQEIDQILDKISLKGYESLTLKEKELLFRASKKEN
ncbi:rhomboid family intramembrane serine protease [Sphingobacterium bovistauri]|uniref:Peptidase S54 n=1 Tax=Sphingobacterium bovistauri TaxID=2781959 RepID=A0ABS7Z4D6_9SPHI|nr:rhomboid family intramembrane serine protease [Sphingobacterium bovistauri]MCA5005014.1 peptidase S54 [Sphingobacterium bovistauri]